MSVCCYHGLCLEILFGKGLGSWGALVGTSHLSEWPSDLKINGTQENETLSCPAFHGLPCGVLL